MSNTGYMRTCRTQGSNRATMQAQSAAAAAAARWVREHHRNIWVGLLADERAKRGLSVEVGPKGTFVSPIQHGTTAGYQQERYRGLDACDLCRAAASTYGREQARRRRSREIANEIARGLQA